MAMEILTGGYNIGESKERVKFMLNGMSECQRPTSPQHKILTALSNIM